MCQECGAIICALFDGLVADYFRAFPPREEDEGRRRPRYMQMDVRNAPESAAQGKGLRELAEQAPDIGLSRIAFLTELSERSGFGEAIQQWMQEKVPNGLARKIILTCAEEILREHGARPALSMKVAA